MWTGKNWQLYFDNAPAHSAHAIKGFLAINNTALVRQPPYYPDLAPFDFWLFPKLKTTLKRTRFQSCKTIMKKTTAELRSIPEEEFKRRFQKWQRRWEKCAHLQGEYFEGNQIKFVIFIVLCVLSPKVGYFLDRLRKVIFIVIDKTDISGCKYVNTLVGDIKQPETSYLFHCKIFDSSPNQHTVLPAVYDAICTLQTNRDNFALLLTDAFRYMTAAGCVVKQTYPRLFHITCMAHGLHNAA